MLGKLLAYAIGIYLTIRIGRFVQALFGKKNKNAVSDKKDGYFKETEIRDAEFTDVKDEDE